MNLPVPTLRGVSQPRAPRQPMRAGVILLAGLMLAPLVALGIAFAPGLWHLPSVPTAAIWIAVWFSGQTARHPSSPACEAAGRPAFLASGVHLPCGCRSSHRGGADQRPAAAHDGCSGAMAGRRTAAAGAGGPALAADLYQAGGRRTPRDCRGPSRPGRRCCARVAQAEAGRAPARGSQPDQRRPRPPDSRIELTGVLADLGYSRAHGSGLDSPGQGGGRQVGEVPREIQRHCHQLV